MIVLRISSDFKLNLTFLMHSGIIFNLTVSMAQYEPYDFAISKAPEMVSCGIYDKSKTYISMLCRHHSGKASSEQGFRNMDHLAVFIVYVELNLLSWLMTGGLGEQNTDQI